MAESGRNESVVVWEWINDFGHWRAYDPRVVGLLEKKRCSSTHVCLGEADRALSNYVLDIRNMQQIRQDTGYCRTVRRRIFPPLSPPAVGISWQWHGDRGEWHQYNFDVASLLENAHNKKIKSIDLNRTVYSLPYTVDLVAMAQRRNETGFLRDVKRVTFPKYPPDSDSGAVANDDLLRTDASRKHGLSDSSIDSGKGSPGTKTKPSKKKNRSTVAPKDSRPPSSRSSTRTFLSKSKSSDSVSTTLSQAPFMHTSQSAVFRTGPNTGACATQPATVPVNQVKGSVIISPVMTGVTNMLLMPIMPIVLSQNIVINPPQAPVSKPKKKERKPKKKSDNKNEANDPMSVLRLYTIEIQVPNSDDDCCICCGKLQESAGFAEDAATAFPVVLKLNNCPHMFHKCCLTAMYESGTKDGSIQCPTCKTIYGEKMGNCPAGRMEIHTIPELLPGETCDTIRIIYHISSGVQLKQSNHPQPGQPFTARGFPRYCYLPNTEKGRKVMLLLKIAWERRLTFTIGTSTTTGELDTVTWNEIHHKTEFGTNHSGHGYPDPNYLDNVLAELAVQGVTP